MADIIEPLSKETAEALEAKARRELDLASRAERLLEDELFHAALAKVREDAVESLVGSKIEDDRARLEARLKIKCLEDVFGEIAKHVRAGVSAKEDLKWLERQKRSR